MHYFKNNKVNTVNITYNITFKIKNLCKMMLHYNAVVISLT